MYLQDLCLLCIYVYVYCLVRGLAAGTSRAGSCTKTLPVQCGKSAYWCVVSVPESSGHEKSSQCKRALLCLLEGRCCQ